MTFKFVAAAAVALALAGCQDTADTAPTAATPLIGKTLIDQNGATFLYHANGTVTGTAWDKPVAATYEASADEICTTFSAPDRLKGKEFCSKPMIDGDEVIFHRRDGSKSPPYKIEG